MLRTAALALFATLTTALMVGTVSAAKPPTPPKPPKPPTPPKITSSNKESPVVTAAKQQMKLGEATVLRHAYLLLISANADYNGHKGQAMGSIQAAVAHLDRSVLKKGTAAQQAATLM